WNLYLVSVKDVVSGNQIPALQGRVYLFGKEVGHPLLCEGTVTVELSVPDEKGQLVPIETWHFDADTLARTVQRDYLGCGYTLILPWNNPRSTDKVVISTRFVPKGGSPLKNETRFRLQGMAAE